MCRWGSALYLPWVSGGPVSMTSRKFPLCVKDLLLWAVQTLLLLSSTGLSVQGLPPPPRLVNAPVLLVLVFFFF